MSIAAVPLDRIPVLDHGTEVWPLKEAFNSGFVIPFDKPLNFSSFDVVKYIRTRLPVKKVGHAGTLDPLATGLLLICCGKATKSINQIHELEKRYRAEIRFGSSTPSQDAGTEINETADYHHITEDLLTDLLSSQFSGMVDQVPPMYSALHKNGKRLYQLARKGVTVDRAPRKITIYNTKIVAMNLPDLTLEVTCGKGTYVRTIADDLGRAAGSLAHLTGLRRLSTGNFSVESAWTPSDFREWSKQYG